MANLHPKGIFNDVKILDHSWDKSKEKGTPFLWVTYETEHGTVTGRWFVTDNTIERFSQQLMDMGFTGESLSDPTLADGTALRGNVVQITVEHEEYDGKIRAKVAWVNENNSTGGASRGALSEVSDVADRFDLLFKKNAGLLKAKASEKVPF